MLLIMNVKKKKKRKERDCKKSMFCFKNIFIYVFARHEFILKTQNLEWNCKDLNKKARERVWISYQWRNLNQPNSFQILFSSKILCFIFRWFSLSPQKKKKFVI